MALRVRPREERGTRNEEPQFPRVGRGPVWLAFAAVDEPEKKKS